MMQRFFIAIVLSVLVFVDTDAYTDADTDVNISAAIKWLLRSNPRHPLMRDSTARDVMARDIGRAARAEGLEPDLLTTVAFYESTFRSWVKGARGEVGLVQVAKHVRIECVRDGYDMAVQIDQLRCGARHLRQMIDDCGTVRGGLTAYGTAPPRCSVPLGTKVRKKINLRIWMAGRLTKKFGGD